MYTNNIQMWVQKDTTTGINIVYSFYNKTMDLIISYLLGVTVNPYENVTCNETMF